MAATISITETHVYTAVGRFLLSVLPAGVEVIRAQVNRVPEPASPDFVTMTSGRRERLATNVTTYTDPGSNPGSTSALQAMRMTIQLDVHGPAGADNATLITTLWRDEYASIFLAAQNAGMAPLYTSDPQQLPFVNGEQQWEDRWTFDLALQVNAVVTTTQEFADTATVGLVNVDVAYPPTENTP